MGTNGHSMEDCNKHKPNHFKHRANKLDSTSYSTGVTAIVEHALCRGCFALHKVQCGNTD